MSELTQLLGIDFMEQLNRDKIISDDLFSFYKYETNLLYNYLQTVPESEEEEFWKRVRESFSFSDNIMIPMNAANLCPTWDLVEQFSYEFRKELNKNVSMQYRVGEKPGEGIIARLTDQARASIANSLNVSSSDLALIRNASEGNNTINNCLDFQDGQSVVIWDQNHGTNNNAWTMRVNRLKKYNISLKVISVSVSPHMSIDKIAEEFAKNVTTSTPLISITEISNRNSMRLPTKKIFAAARTKNPNIHCHLDGTMAWGAMDLDLKDINCDSFVSSGHKWFLGPKETGIFYMKKALVHKFTPNIFAYDGRIRLPDPNDLAKDAQRFEAIGQRDDPNLMALLATDLLNKYLVGFKRTETRVLKLAGDLFKELNNIDERTNEKVKLVTPTKKGYHHGLVIFEIDPKGKYRPVPDAGFHLYNYLYNGYKIGAAASMNIAKPGQKPNRRAVRFCPHIYNVPAHLKMATQGVEEWLTRFIIPK